MLDSMPRYAENIVEFVRRGGVVFTDTRLVAVRCCDCARAFLLDEGSGRLFLDPSDLRAIAEEDDPIPCPGCGRSEWDLEDVPDHELEHFSRGRWGFSFWTPPPRRAPRTKAKRIAIAIGLGTLTVVGIGAFALNPDPLAAPGKARPQIDLGH